MKKNATVIDCLGMPIGKVREIGYDPWGQPTWFVVRRGLIFRHDVALPVDWIGMATTEQVTLNVPRGAVDARMAGDAGGA